MLILNIIAGTPIWVWGILGVLIFLGLRARYSRVVAIEQLFVVPCIFLLWSLPSLVRKCSIAPSAIGFWLAGILLGAYVGKQIAYFTGSKRTTDGKLVIPGSYTMLFLSLTAFTVKYCFGVMHAINSELFLNPAVYISEWVILGLITGIFWGRLLGLWYKHGARA